MTSSHRPSAAPARMRPDDQHGPEGSAEAELCPASHEGPWSQAAMYLVRQGLSCIGAMPSFLIHRLAGFTSNGLQLSQLTQTGIRSECASNSFDNLDQQCGSSHPQLSQVPATVYCLELTETDYIS